MPIMCYLNEPVCPDKIDRVFWVEELGVGQPQLPVVDQTAELLVKKSGHSFGSLVIGIFNSEKLARFSVVELLF